MEGALSVQKGSTATSAKAASKMKKRSTTAIRQLQQKQQQPQQQQPMVQNLSEMPTRVITPSDYQHIFKRGDALKMSKGDRSGKEQSPIDQGRKVKRSPEMGQLPDEEEEDDETE